MTQSKNESGNKELDFVNRDPRVLRAWFGEGYAYWIALAPGWRWRNEIYVQQGEVTYHHVILHSNGSIAARQLRHNVEPCTCIACMPDEWLGKAVVKAEP